MQAVTHQRSICICILYKSVAGPASHRPSPDTSPYDRKVKLLAVSNFGKFPLPLVGRGRVSVFHVDFTFPPFKKQLWFPMDVRVEVYLYDPPGVWVDVGIRTADVVADDSGSGIARGTAISGTESRLLLYTSLCNLCMCQEER